MHFCVISLFVRLCYHVSGLLSYQSCAVEMQSSHEHTDAMGCGEGEEGRGWGGNNKGRL